MNTRNQRALVVVITAAFVVAIILSVTRLRSARSSAERAADNLQHCQALSKRMEVMKSKPAQIALESQTSRDLALCVQKASQAAGLLDGTVASINPQASRRIRDSAYLEQNSDLDIREVSLEQLIRFLNEAIARQNGLRVTSIRLQAPRALGGSSTSTEKDMWTSEVTLTHLVFSPKSAASTSLR